MTFALYKITMTNFRSYLGIHEFEYPTKCGLYFLAGQNTINPALGANAAGKSTFLDAITWVLFGRTTRGLKANEVISWGALTTSVTLVLTVGDRQATITRTQKPNGLFLDDKAVDQEELQKYLRLNYESFQYSVLNPQFTPAFFSLQSTNKLTLFSDIMGLEFWLEKSKEASKLVEEMQMRLDDLIAAINRYDGQILTIENDIQDLKGLSSVYEDARDARIKNIKQEAISTYAESKASKRKLGLINSKRQTLHAELKTLLKELSDLDKTREIKLNIITVMSKKHKETEDEKTVIRHTINHTSNTGYCNLCVQNITPEYAKTLKRQATGVLVDLEIKQVKISRQKVEATEQVAKLRLQISRKENQCTEVRSDISNLDVKDTKLQIRLNTTNQRLDDIVIKLDEAKSGKNPHEEMLQAKQNKLKALKKHLADAIENKDKLEAQCEAIKFWIKGFKRVRLFIIEQAFNTLEIEVNNILTQLGMPDWQITFDVERENKSGGITKGFVVFIKGPNNSEPVRWESWSGGETQRLQLAGDLGLANLIMQRAGLRNTIEFFDEPSTHLSPEGMMDLANMLHERAIEEDKTIWIVDHTSITNFGEFEKTITVEKTENGSSITNK